MLRNRRGATSLRWLRALLDHGIEVHGQIVVCPGRNDGAILDDTLAGVLDRFPELASLCVVPLGVSRYNTEPSMRPHTRAEAAAVVAAVHDWQDIYLATLGHRLVFAADEYYLLAAEPFPEPGAYEGFPMHEDGVGMARTFELEFTGAVAQATGVATGFFAWVDGAPAEGYRAPRVTESPNESVTESSESSESPAESVTGRAESPTESVPRKTGITLLTGEYGAQVLAPVADELAAAAGAPVRVVPVANRFFGGNIAVTGLLTGADVARAVDAAPAGERILLPDVVLSNGRFLDDSTPAELPRAVEVVATDGASLVKALRA
jgi:NifB/MoaA-like Fe-S oxidoreductase